MIRESILLNELYAQGVSLRAAPIITPDFASGNMDYGVQLAVKYSL